MTAPNVRDADLPPMADETPRRHVRLTRASIDGPKRETIARRPKTIRRMSPARRLEKLRRLRATLEPPRSWLCEK